MIKNVLSLKKFYLCQGGDWQTIVEAECEESAATQAIEKIMLDDGEKLKLSAVIYVRQLPSCLAREVIENSHQTMLFYAPMIMANAGFHTEASRLQNYLDSIQDEENE